MGDDECPYVIKPSFWRPRERYRELNASRRRRVRPSVPDARAGGRLSQVGRSWGGAGPGCWYSSSCWIVAVEELSAREDGVGAAIPMMLAMLATTWVSTGGVIASAYAPE